MKQFSRSLIFHHINRYIAQNIKARSHKILRLWCDQCEYILAQRFRRGQQMICHYTRLWEERALKELLQRFRVQVQRHARIIIIGGIGLFLYDWDKELVYCDGLQTHINDIDYVKRLLLKDTIICPLCNRRKIIDNKIEGIEYCKCSKETLKQYELNLQNNINDKNKLAQSINHANNKNDNNNKSNINNNADSTSNWIPYLERENIIIWRREEKQGLYAYKVYAQYDDITAEDFLYVQTDIEYRKKWDKTAVKLDVIESNPNDKGRNQIIYWEMLWPKLFANRDYVYKRRYAVDRQRKLIVITNKSVTHPQCPVNPHNQRVQDYWSYMVIKPKTTFKKPGLEYVLTYFDNPGVVVPPAVTSWVAQRQMPDFLKRLHCATLDYSNTKPNENEIYAVWDSLRDPGYEYPPEPNMEKRHDENDDDVGAVVVDDCDDTNHNCNNRNNMGNDGAPMEKPKKNTVEKKKQISIVDDDDDDNNNDRDDLPSSVDDNNNNNNSSTKTTSWWSYFHPYYYFA